MSANMKSSCGSNGNSAVKLVANNAVIVSLSFVHTACNRKKTAVQTAAKNARQ